MLSYRFGYILAPDGPHKLDCSFCHREFGPSERCVVVETDPVHNTTKNELEFLAAYETACLPCGEAMKDAALRLKVPVDWDIRVMPGTKLDVGEHRMRND